MASTGGLSRLAVLRIFPERCRTNQVVATVLELPVLTGRASELLVRRLLYPDAADSQVVRIPVRLQMTETAEGLVVQADGTCR